MYAQDWKGSRSNIRVVEYFDLSKTERESLTAWAVAQTLVWLVRGSAKLFTRSANHDADAVELYFDTGDEASPRLAGIVRKIPFNGQRLVFEIIDNSIYSTAERNPTYILLEAVHHLGGR